jgi:hypothetical protein
MKTFATSIAEDFGNGGVIDGDITISGDLTVEGNGTGNFDEIVNGNSHIVGGILQVSHDSDKTENILLYARNTARFSGTASPGVLETVGCNTLEIGTAGSQPIYFATNATTRMTISSAGDVQITDTTTSSTTEGGYLRLASDDGAAMASGHRLGVIEFAGAVDASNTITSSAKIQAMTDATWSGSEHGTVLDFYTSDGSTALGSGNPMMRIDAAGNVAIGTDNAGAKLHVKGANDNSNGQLKIESTGTDARIHFINSSGDSSTSGNADILMSATSGYEGLRFMIDNSDKMIIDENGNVGIGTASPYYIADLRFANTDTSFSGGSSGLSLIHI